MFLHLTSYLGEAIIFVILSALSIFRKKNSGFLKRKLDLILFLLFFYFFFFLSSLDSFPRLYFIFTSIHFSDLFIFLFLHAFLSFFPPFLYLFPFLLFLFIFFSSFNHFSFTASLFA